VELGRRTTWLRMVREATRAGRRFTRVRVVSVPLTDYSRFAVFCSGQANAAGEDIRYLQRDEAESLPDRDYWLFDSHKLVRMHFDDDEMLGGEGGHRPSGDRAREPLARRGVAPRLVAGNFRQQIERAA
jgi:hypothetical protein